MIGYTLYIAIVTVLTVQFSRSEETGFTYEPFDPEELGWNSSDTDPDFRIFVEPSPSLGMFMEETSTINVTYIIACDDADEVYHLKAYISETNVAHMITETMFNISCSSEDTWTNPNGTYSKGIISLTLQAELIGRTWLMFDKTNGSSSDVEDRLHEGQPVDKGEHLYKYLVTVIRKARPIDTIFRVLVFFFLIISTIGMGCKMELDVVFSVLKKPIAPAIGFFCQYLIMPMIAFAVAKTIKFQDPAVGLGIFASGICPGGGASNIYSYLLGGDISLSVTMTTISNIGALGMIPLWIFTLGQQFQDDKIRISIPYLDILQTLATVILPLFVGVFIKYKCQKVAKMIMKVLKPVTFVTIAIVLTFGIYANLYIFRLFKPKTFLAGCLLPYAGYILGGLTGLIFRIKWYRVKTIAIETGVQNTMVAYIMLLTALPAPDGDLAAVGPVASAVMTPIPLFIIAIVYNIYLKCTGKDNEHVGEGMGNGTVENGKAKKAKDKKRYNGKDSNGKSNGKDEAEIELVDKLSSL